MQTPPLVTPAQKSVFRSRKYVLSVALGAALLLLSLVINSYAVLYATQKASNPVSDIILDNIPVFNVDGIFVYGPILMWLFVTLVCVRRPQRIPLVLKSVAFFVIIRSVFISLTHIGPYQTRMVMDSPAFLYKEFTAGGDLFFSAHTGLPFLMAMVFYSSKFYRWFFIIMSVFFGCIVLMGHVHYSIDVLSSFFITYTIYTIVIKLFPYDYKLFEKGSYLDSEDIKI